MQNKEKEYVCGYKHCLHHGDKVKDSESVVIGKKHYHWDCAALKQEIQDCADTYVEYIGDKTKYPMILKIITTMVFNNHIPIDYIKEKIEHSRSYYKDRPVYALYGIRNLFWEYEIKNRR